MNLTLNRATQGCPFKDEFWQWDNFDCLLAMFSAIFICGLPQNLITTNETDAKSTYVNFPHAASLIDIWLQSKMNSHQLQLTRRTVAGKTVLKNYLIHKPNHVNLWLPLLSNPTSNSLNHNFFPTNSGSSKLSEPRSASFMKETHSRSNTVLTLSKSGNPFKSMQTVFKLRMHYKTL